MKLRVGRRATLIAAGIAGALLLGWLATSQGPLAPAKVTLAKVEKRTLSASTFGIGTVEARRSYALGPTLASRVARVLVDQGDVVTAGQLLAELDPVDLEDRVASAQLAALDTASFLAELRAEFGERVGAFTDAGERSAFALTLRYRQGGTRPRSLAVGNAAQTLHPVAGQGFNLGLRDAWELARLAQDAPDPGSDAFVASYRRARSVDRRAGIQFTDGLVGLFSNSRALLALGRGAGLLALDMLPFARRFVARRMIYGARAIP